MDEHREQARVNRLIELATVMRYDRRQILKRAAAFGLSAPAIAMVLAACGGDDDDDDTDDAPTESTDGGQEATATEAGEEEPTEAEGEATEAEGDATEAEGDATEAGGDATEAEGNATEAEGEETEEESGGTAAGRGGLINIPVTTGDSGIGNPILNSEVAAIAWYVFNRLMTYDDTGTLQPELAESWEFSDDNLELTLNLAEANWHDGEPFSADDVVFTFDTIQAENTDTAFRSRLQVGGEFMTWEATDERTLTLTMSEPFAPVLFSLSDIEIIPKHILEGVDDINTADFNKNPVGTGPFRFVEWVPDQFVRLERNEDYFRREVLPDGLTYFFLADSNAARASLESGEIDMFFTPPEMQANFEDSADFNLLRYVYFTSITMAFNHKHEILAELDFRKAIEMGIDKQSWTDTVTRGRSPITNNQFAEGGPLDRYNDYDNVAIVEFDPDGAAAALDGLGWTAGDDGIRQRDGERLSFNVITYSGFDEYQNGMVIFQDQMAQLGIEITPNVVDYTSLEAMWADPDDDPANRAFELEEWPHPFEFDPDLYNELHSDNIPPGGNYMWYENPEIDELIIQGRTTTDPEGRAEIYKQIDVLRSEDLPSIPLYLAVDGWVTSPAVLNADGEPISTPYFRRYVLTDADRWWKES